VTVSYVLVERASRRVEESPVNEQEPKANETPDDAAAQAEVNAELKAAEDEVKQARQRLRKAKQSVRDARLKAKQDAASDGRDASLGDVLDRTLSLVKKHPGLGIAAAAAAGFLLGRLFRRW
jgi:ElaB/YqjD/DUF883 family membrane-anchored ribosome-binding protein